MEPWQNTEDEEEILNDTNRDNYFRCKFCGVLWHQNQCVLDEIKGYECPDGCKETFEQPPYQSPLSND